MRAIALCLLATLVLGAALTACSSGSHRLVVRATPGWPRQGKAEPCPHGFRCESFSFDVCEERGQDVPVLPHGGVARCSPAVEKKVLVARGSYSFTTFAELMYNGKEVWDVDGFTCPGSELDVNVRFNCSTRNNGGHRTGRLTKLARIDVSGHVAGKPYHRAYHIAVDVNVHGGIAVTALDDSAPYVYRPGHCLTGYRCEPVHKEVCSNHPKDPFSRAHLTLLPVSPARCNEYSFDMTLVVAYNGSRVQIVPKSLVCPVTVSHIHMHVRCSTESQFVAGFNTHSTIVTAHIYARASQYGYEAIVQIIANTHGHISTHTIVP